ncbi:MAG: hypothetical protein JWR42_1033 [Marmoricola sp.]|nr:hypothetical protein [Marmoricola sp.]
MLIGLLAALAAAVLFGATAVLQAVVVRRSGLVSWPMVGVTVGYLLGWVFHLVAIALLPLYLAQMAIGGSLAVTALAASRVVGEPLARRHWWAIGAMVLGFAALVASAAAPGPSHQVGHLTPALYAAVAVLAISGLLAWRLPAPRGGAALGLLGGLAYAGAPIATRDLEHVTLDLHVLLPALTVPLFGALGFVLQSVALERVSVTAATAPMVLLETFVPAALGVLLFADRVRPHLGGVAVLAFLVATAGALVLSGAEGRLGELEGPGSPPGPPGHPGEHAGDLHR